MSMSHHLKCHFAFPLKCNHDPEAVANVMGALNNTGSSADLIRSSLSQNDLAYYGKSHFIQRATQSHKQCIIWRSKSESFAGDGVAKAYSWLSGKECEHPFITALDDGPQ